VTTLEERRQQLERHAVIAFPLESFRRFKEMDGRNLALVIGVNLFIAVIPLLILGYALIEAFNPHRSFGVVLIQRFHLTGDTARVVRDTFTSAKSGKNTALSISLVSLFVTGFGLAAAVQVVYARAFRMQPLRGLQKYLRGGAWMLALLVMESVGLTLRYWASSRPLWFLLLTIPVLLTAQFGFYLVTPRLVIHLPFGWRDLAPGAAFCTIAATVVNAISAYLLRNWFSAYGHAYGGFGIGLALMSYIGITATFWVWIAAVSGVYWERKAGTTKVASMEEQSADNPPRPNGPSISPSI